MATNTNSTFILDPSYRMWSHLLNYNFMLTATQADVDAALLNSLHIADIPSTSYNELISFSGSVGLHPSIVALGYAYNSPLIDTPEGDSVLNGTVTFSSATTVNANEIGWFSYDNLGSTDFATLAPTYFTNPSASYAGNAVAQHSVSSDSTMVVVSYEVGKAGSDLVTAVFSADTVAGTYTQLVTGADVVFSGTPLTGSESFTSDPTIHIYVGVGIIETFVAGTSVTGNVFISANKA